MASENLLPYS